MTDEQDDPNNDNDDDEGNDEDVDDGDCLTGPECFPFD